MMIYFVNCCFIIPYDNRIWFFSGTRDQSKTPEKSTAWNHEKNETPEREKAKKVFCYNAKQNHTTPAKLNHTTRIPKRDYC